MTTVLINLTGADLRLKSPSGNVIPIPAGAAAPLVANENYQITNGPFGGPFPPPPPGTTLTNSGGLIYDLIAVPPGVAPNVIGFAPGNTAVLEAVTYHIT